MAYDPNDPADKKIVDDAVAAALADQQEAHEAEIEGLKKNKTRLLAQLKAARAGEGGAAGEDQGAEIERLEGELAATKRDLSAAQRDLRKVTAERDTAVATATTETTLNRNILVENGLTEALVAANVAPQFMPAVRALLKEQVKVEGEGAERKVLGSDGKPLGEFVKAWSQGDAGKHYIKAPDNSGGGGGGGGGNPQGGAKKLEDMSEAERREMAMKDPDGFKAIRRAAGQAV